MHPVESSSLLAVGYDGAANVLTVRFHSGAVYRYFGVRRAEYEALLGAESLGAHFNKHIRERYRFERIG